MSRLVVFIVDVGDQIGTGHVMRCLNLAIALKKNLAFECQFICRSHKGHCYQKITTAGFTLHLLPETKESLANSIYASCLGVTCKTDAQQTIQIIEDKQLNPVWLIIDHYTIDKEWEQTFKKHCQRIMVIDDLANRTHDCNVLLDEVLENVDVVLGEVNQLLPTDFPESISELIFTGMRQARDNLV